MTWLHIDLWLKSTSNDFVAYAYTSPTTDSFVRGVVAHRSKARLQQFYPRRATSLPAATPSVCAQCHGTSCVPASSLVATTSSHMLSQLFTGCVYLSGLSSRSLWWSFESCMVWRRHMWISYLCCHHHLRLLLHPDRSSLHMSLRSRGHSFDVLWYK